MLHHLECCRSRDNVGGLYYEDLNVSHNKGIQNMPPVSYCEDRITFVGETQEKEQMLWQVKRFKNYRQFILPWSCSWGIILNPKYVPEFLEPDLLQMLIIVCSLMCCHRHPLYKDECYGPCTEFGTCINHVINICLIFLATLLVWLKEIEMYRDGNVVELICPQPWVKMKSGDTFGINCYEILYRHSSFAKY